MLSNIVRFGPRIPRMKIEIFIKLNFERNVQPPPPPS